MKRILITGASRGIGRAIAEKLAAPESTLLLHGRDENALQETKRRAEERGARTEIIRCELSEANAVAKLELGVVDVLVNNAGIAVVKPFSEVSLGEWQRTVDVNVTAPFLLTQKVALSMPDGGSIVNILSIAAKTGFAGWSSYCMSKFALEGFMQSVRAELRPRGIRVINIYPAATDTDIWQGVEGDWPRDKMMSAEQIASAVAYALAQPPSVVLENITLSNTAGAL
ncbi:MAG: SDR family NAD(P)-dependent oxidoreductase [Verrucomicrobiota bacterium]|nr:SDR family NAD(P)-dependent oxidoreductase [Verrucomicrobiota bacterium]